ncbi:abortive infection family protein [Thioalkalivibrio sp. HK1]|nr:abortive infection family protein [Thioalkalivibrio sp. HK1]
MDEKDLKKIASGLFQIVDGTMHLRNKKSAAHTASLYVLELMEKG